MTPKVGIVMGSISDWPVMKEAEAILKEFGVEVDKRVLSAHRTPHELEAWVNAARDNGISSIIAGAGGAAHLAGSVAALTTLPVIGVPVKSRSLGGFDSLLSMVQMPPGIPVATVGVDGARNAGLLAIEMMALGNQDLTQKLDTFRRKQVEKILATKFPDKE